MTNEDIIYNPRCNEDASVAMCDYINSRKVELIETARALEASVTAENWDDPQTKAAVDDLADAVEDLRESGKRLVREVCAETKAQAVLTQIDSRLWSYSTKADPQSAYADLSAALKGIKAKIDAFKAATLPPLPTHSYVARMNCTDKVLDGVLKKAVKDGATDVLATVPQSDKAVKVIQKWFEENV